MAKMTAKDRYYSETGMIAKGFTQPTDRVKRIKKAILDATPMIETERATLVTEVYKETEGLTPIMRRAKVNEKLLLESTIVIREDELIVGSRNIHRRSSDLGVEFSCQWLVPEFDTIATRACDPFYIREEDKKYLLDLFKYWDGRTLSEYALATMSEETLRAQDAGVFDVGNYLYAGVGHTVPNYERILQTGFTGVIEQVEAEMKKLDRSDPENIAKWQFYEATLITYRAAIAYAHRYEKLAAEMAAKETDPVRKAELLQISKNCAHVPEFGARNFYEACQSFWFVHNILNIESNGHSVSPGPWDRFMWAFYKNDPTITPDFAQELVDCVFLKMADCNKVRDDLSARAFAGYQLFEMVALGGQDADGNDLTNDLSYMCLTALAHTGMPSPSLACRISNKTPDEFLYRTCETIRLGYGMPNVFNDEIIIPAMINRGISLRDARTYTPSGCVEPDLNHRYDGWHDAASFNVSKVLEITLHNGLVEGRRIGPATGDVTKFTSIDQLWEAFEKQMAYFVSLMVEADNCIDRAHGQLCPLPFQSALIEDCISRGKSVQEGGARYNFSGPQGCGIVDAGDSIHCIDKHIFQDKRWTMAQLMEALDANFGYPVPEGSSTGHDDWGNHMNAPEGSCTASCGGSDAEMEAKIYEAVKAILNGSGSVNMADIRNKVSTCSTTACGPEKYAEMRSILDNTLAYGNDDDEVDAYTVRVGRIYCEEVQKHKNARGGQFQAGMYPVSNNVLYGKNVHALPTGRLAKMPYGDGVGPRAGKDTNGPTAAANSVSKLDHALASNGTLYNMKFLPAALAGDTGIKNLAGLIRGYFERKGMHVQFNVVDRETLLDAQAHPEEYKDLVIRVAGYSAQFVSLDKEVQDGIIARTEQVF